MELMAFNASARQFPQLDNLFLVNDRFETMPIKTITTFFD